jgi:metallophosphoesterase (TIGR00282 family)
MTINVLFIGDVVGRPGRRLVRDLLPSLVAKYEVDLVVANGENAAGGLGLTIKAAEELFNYGVDVLTSGNHIFRHKELYDYFDSQPYLIRPANYPESAPGRGWVLARTKGGDPVGIINVMGRTFMEPLDCPFRKAKEAIADLAEDGVKMMLVDIHAEATSEKKALGWYLDGHVGAVIGTHTHVQTADAAILPNGTGYLTDAGMTGGQASVIGMKPEAVIQRFVTGLPTRFEVSKRDLRLEGCVIGLNPMTGGAEKVERIQKVPDLSLK